jgi:hypothetical protein
MWAPARIRNERRRREQDRRSVLVRRRIEVGDVAQLGDEFGISLNWRMRWSPRKEAVYRKRHDPLGDREIEFGNTQGAGPVARQAFEAFDRKTRLPAAKCRSWTWPLRAQRPERALKALSRNACRASEPRSTAQNDGPDVPPVPRRQQILAAIDEIDRVRQTRGHRRRSRRQGRPPRPNSSRRQAAGDTPSSATTAPKVVRARTRLDL